MTEEPANGEDAFSPAQGKRGVGMTEVVQADIGQNRIGPDSAPETVQLCSAPRPIDLSKWKDPGARARDALDDFTGGARQPHSLRSRLGIAQKQVPVPVVGPTQGQDLALATSGEQKQADCGDFERPLCFV